MKVGDPSYLADHSFQTSTLRRFRERGKGDIISRLETPLATHVLCASSLTRALSPKKSGLQEKEDCVKEMEKYLIMANKKSEEQHKKKRNWNMKTE